MYYEGNNEKETKQALCSNIFFLTFFSFKIIALQNCAVNVNIIAVGVFASVIKKNFGTTSANCLVNVNILSHSSPNEVKFGNFVAVFFLQTPLWGTPSPFYPFIITPRPSGAFLTQKTCTHTVQVPEIFASTTQLSWHYVKAEGL